MEYDMPATGPRTSGPRTQQKRPGDLTGVRGQQLAKQRDAEKAQAATEVELAQAAEAERKRNEVVDYTKTQTPVAEVVEQAEVEVKSPVRRIRVNFPIEEMTFGKELLDPGEQDENGAYTRLPTFGSMRTYTFEEGRWYDVPADVAEHLEYLGYIWS